MKYRIVKEVNPSRDNCGRYLAKAVHPHTVETDELEKEVRDNCSATRGCVAMVLTELSETITRYLKRGDRVRLKGVGLLKLEIESDKVDDPKQYDPRKHIRNYRIYLIPESSAGRQKLYEGIKLEREA